MSMNFEI